MTTAPDPLAELRALAAEMRNDPIAAALGRFDYDLDRILDRLDEARVMWGCLVIPIKETDRAD